ncbi:hypothetical protein QM306_40870, partial [Burkholderia cenocepacia]|nr:hypothetical protein [Burkholderia cenocepacia]
AAELFDRKTARQVRHDTPETIYAELVARTRADDPRVVVTFPVELPEAVSDEEIAQWLSGSWSPVEKRQINGSAVAFSASA